MVKGIKIARGVFRVTADKSLTVRIQDFIIYAVTAKADVINDLAEAEVA